MSFLIFLKTCDVCQRGLLENENGKTLEKKKDFKRDEECPCHTTRQVVPL